MRLISSYFSTHSPLQMPPSPRIGRMRCCDAHLPKLLWDFLFTLAAELSPRTTGSVVATWLFCLMFGFDNVNESCLAAYDASNHQESEQASATWVVVAVTVVVVTDITGSVDRLCGTWSRKKRHGRLVCSQKWLARPTCIQCTPCIPVRTHQLSHINNSNTCEHSTQQFASYYNVYNSWTVTKHVKN